MNIARALKLLTKHPKIFRLIYEELDTINCGVLLRSGNDRVYLWKGHSVGGVSGNARELMEMYYKILGI